MTPNRGGCSDPMPTFLSWPMKKVGGPDLAIGLQSLICNLLTLPLPQGNQHPRGLPIGEDPLTSMPPPPPPHGSMNRHFLMRVRDQAELEGEGTLWQEGEGCARGQCMCMAGCGDHRPHHHHGERCNTEQMNTKHGGERGLVCTECRNPHQHHMGPGGTGLLTTWLRAHFSWRVAVSSRE